MKATYQKPEIMFDVMETEEMIAISNYGNPENGFDLSSEGMQETDATEGNLSRRNVWDDGLGE